MLTLGWNESNFREQLALIVRPGMATEIRREEQEKDPRRSRP